MYRVSFYRCCSKKLVEVWDLNDERVNHRMMDNIYYKLQDLMYDARNGEIFSAVVSDLNAEKGNVAIAVLERLVNCRVHRLVMTDGTRWYEKDYGFGGCEL